MTLKPRLTRVAPRIVATLAVLTLGTATVAFAYGPLARAESTHGGSVQGAALQKGTLSLRTSRPGAAVLTGRNMGPGDLATGLVTVTNEGDVPAAVTLSSSHREETPGSGPGLLSRRLGLLVQDVTGPPARVYRGSAAGMERVRLGVFAPGESRSYRFAVAFPEDGDHDDAYQGARLGSDFDWTAVQVERPAA